MLYKDFIRKIYENKQENITIIFPMLGIYEFTKILLYDDDIKNIKKECDDLFPLSEKVINYNKIKLTIDKYEKIMCCLNKLNIIDIELDILYNLKFLINKDDDINNVTIKIDKNLYQINANKYYIYSYDELDKFIADNFTDIISLNKCLNKEKIINDYINDYIKFLLNNKSDINYPNDFIKFLVDNKIIDIKNENKKELIYNKIISNYKQYINNIKKVLKNKENKELIKELKIGTNINKYLDKNCLEKNLNKLNAEIKSGKICDKNYKKIIIKKVK